MTRYSKSFLFPDLNVWVALSYTKHAHYDRAQRWFVALPEDAHLCFCRFTQIGFLRLLTTPAVMGDEVLGQAAAWSVYDDWLREGGASCLEEPPSLEGTFRSMTQSKQAASKDWADSYLAAFATAAGMQLVTFDRAFYGRLENLLILKP
jgi:toxin-antitoxin system PIN domain toxin